jgi:hypothetical protein
MTDEYPFAFVAEHGADAGLGEAFEGFHHVISERARELTIPPFCTTVVLTDDLPASVIERGQPDFTAERLGGNVTGKTLAERSDYSSAALVIGAAGLGTGDAIGALHVMGTLAHEYGHVFLGRLRATAGTEASVPDPPTPTEAARAVLQFAADEVRCDRFANAIFEG